METENLEQELEERKTHPRMIQNIVGYFIYDGCEHRDHKTLGTVYCPAIDKKIEDCPEKCDKYKQSKFWVERK